MVTMLPMFVSARVRTIQTEREFGQQLNKSHLLVALFYEGVDKSLFRTYETVSGKKLYDDADVVFTKINMRNQSTQNIAKRYAIRTNPVFIIFIDGKPVLDTSGKIAQLTGSVSENELQQFINEYCMLDIKQKVISKEQNRKERVVKAQEESDPYFYPAVYYAPEYDFSWQKPLKYDSEGNEKQ